MGCLCFKLALTISVVLLLVFAGCFGQDFPRVSRFPVPSLQDLSHQPRLLWQAEFAGQRLMWAADRREGIIVAYCAGSEPAGLAVLNRTGRVLARIQLPGPPEAAAFRVSGQIVQILAYDDKGQTVQTAVNDRGKEQMPLLEEPYPWDEMHRLAYRADGEEVDLGAVDGRSYLLQSEPVGGRAVLRAFVRLE